MKITVSIGAAFPTPFRFAEFLKREGCLERMITFVPRFRLKSRFQLTLDGPCLVTFPWLAYLNYVSWRFIGNPPWLAYPISDEFDRLASLHLGDCDIFNGWSAVALRSMRRAKSLGAMTVLNTGSAHVAFQATLLEEEYSKFGLKFAGSGRRMIEKGTREFLEADHIIVASTFVRRTLVEEGIPESKISVVPDAVTRQFKSFEKTDAVFRIITVGGLGFRKGLHYLLEAVRQLRLPNAELLLVGRLQAEYAPILKKYEGHYRWAGPVSEEELAKCYSQSSVFVLPSVEDGWGHVTLEAMSCGLPAIVSANAGSADAVQEGINGFVVPACDTGAIMEKLEFLYRNPEARERMGRQARSSVRNRTWDTYGMENKSVFEALLSRRG